MSNTTRLLGRFWTLGWFGVAVALHGGCSEAGRDRDRDDDDDAGEAGAGNQNGNPAVGGSSAGTASGSLGVGYCQLCSASSQCSSGHVCRQVTGTQGLCAERSEPECCLTQGSSQICYYLNGELSGGGSAGTGSPPASGGTSAGGPGAGGTSAGGTGGTSAGGPSAGAGAVAGSSVGGTGGLEGGSCEDFTPCGGDVQGSWNVRSSCLELALSPFTQPECAGALANANASVTGTLTFDASTATQHTETASILTLVITDACAAALGGSTSVTAATLCPALADSYESNPEFQSAACDLDAAACTCDLVGQPAVNDSTTSYTIEGTELVDDTGARASYCVEDGVLTYRSLTADGELTLVFDRI